MPTHLLCMPTHLPCMREDLDLLLTRALWGILMMLPQAAQTTLTRLMSQATRTIVLPRMPCQVAQALMRNHKKVIQVNLHISYSTCISFKFCLTALSAALTKEHPAASRDNETEDEDGEAERLVECESCHTSMPW